MWSANPDLSIGEGALDKALHEATSNKSKTKEVGHWVA